MEQAVSSGSLNQDVLSSITWTVSNLVRHEETRLQVMSSEVLVEFSLNHLQQSTNKPDQVKIVFFCFTPLIPGDVSIGKFIKLNSIINKEEQYFRWKFKIISMKYLTVQGF